LNSSGKLHGDSAFRATATRLERKLKRHQPINALIDQSEKGRDAVSLKIHYIMRRVRFVGVPGGQRLDISLLLTKKLVENQRANATLACILGGRCLIIPFP